MDDVMVEIHLENLDRRLTSVEQILPTLATKEDLLAAIAPLATKEELREVARRLEIFIEAQGDDIRLLAEAVATMIARIDAWGPPPS